MIFGEGQVYEQALHTYFAVADIHQASISGLEGTTYIDKTDGFQRKTLGREPLRIAKETDQVHLNTNAACVVHDPGWSRRIIIEKSGSNSTVVWPTRPPTLSTEEVTRILNYIVSQRSAPLFGFWGIDTSLLNILAATVTVSAWVPFHRQTN